MTVEELKARIDAGNPPILLDVREPAELRIARYPMHVVHIPMGVIARRFTELTKDAEIVCACRSGGRSAQVVQFLKQKGFTNVANLEGGLLAWSRQIDPSVPQY